ncbi:MAG: type II toxin-antitoxin system VapC family toxin [Deltaproteobacteria bacterium]|nr:type II toxin-antitoxin system VapC family toxin [Deltaproteobacteria bacterium]
MNAIFADTGYWIALFNPRDDLHAKALTISRAIQGRLIVTSQMVLTEFLNYYASLGQLFRQQAVQVVRSLQQAGEVEIVPQTDEQFQAALTLYAQRSDKEWSLVDCASFLIMQARHLTEALAHDEHFQQAGFVPLLRDH